MKVQVIGGFLGAGKTTAMRALARHLTERGERVLLVTNDQGRGLVDTALCERTVPGGVREIVGGCFCCRYDQLEATVVRAAEAGATVALLEAVGSCTDLVATVLAPLADRHPGRLSVLPLAVVVDPFRVAEVAAGSVPSEVAYLFYKQIEEADVVLLSRADLSPPDVSAAIRAIRPDLAVVPVSGLTGAGIDRWLSARPARPAPPLLIDYDRYAAAEALLGWLNARVTLRAETPFMPARVMEDFLRILSSEPVAHVKLTGSGPDGGGAALLRRGGEPMLDESPHAAPVCEAQWIVNARVALPPAELEARLRDALGRAAHPARVEWDELSCFQPARPVPTHRYAFRCGSGDDASCCAAFYERPDVRYLLGESLHPGGVELTLQMAGRLALHEGRRVLDVACGNGRSLRAILSRWPVRGVGLDASARPLHEDRLTLCQGDAHAVPFEEADFDAVLCECALSTFFDQPGALAEMRRVLRPGGRLAVSDMVVEGPIPEALRDYVHAGTCLQRALSADGYRRALRDAGLPVTEEWDATDALHELIGRIKRNLVGAALAAASGGQPLGGKFDVKAARDLLREAERAVRAGAVQYRVLIAERPA